MDAASAKEKKLLAFPVIARAGETFLIKRMLFMVMLFALY
jgi:hypothetical protein